MVESSSNCLHLDNAARLGDMLGHLDTKANLDRWLESQFPCLVDVDADAKHSLPLA